MNIEANDVKFFVDGKSIGEVTAIDAKIDWKTEPAPDLGKIHEITLEGAYINYDRLTELFLESQARCKVVAESRKYPRGDKLPKKKRIRNKWIKKYHKQIEFDNVTFE